MQDPEEQPVDPFAVRKVGKGWRAAAKYPYEPQRGLVGSNHPYSPFPGNALRWESWVFDDASTYEGLTREGIPHGKGVLHIGTATGGGFQFPTRGDRYDGEFFAGFAHGLGAYTKPDGRMYKGEFTFGRRHGCGVERNMMPWFKLLEEGMDPTEAWEQVKEEVNRSAKKGTWQKDFFTKPITRGGCSQAELDGTEEEVSEVVAKVRMFEYKPDGDVTFMMAQDKNGMPLPLYQDPLHYPHGTQFLAPGPLGQCWPVPEEPGLRAEMELAARNHERIFNMYNLPYDVEPGSDLAAALELRLKKGVQRLEKRERRAQLEKRRLRRLEKKAAADVAPPKKEGGGFRWLFWRKKAASKVESPSSGLGPAPGASVGREPDDDADDDVEGGDISDDDLIASVPDGHLQSGAPGAGGRKDGAGGPPPGTVFGSLSLGMGQGLGSAAGSATRLFTNFAVRAERRRTLTRPSRR